MPNPLKWLLGRLTARQARRMCRHFHSLTGRPVAVQRDILLRQIRREAPTAFGRDHGFREIRSVADFRKHLPITKYEYYQPYIDRVRRGETEAMFHRQKVLMFAMTSGTTASRKYIPVTQRYLSDYRRGWMIWGIHMFQDHKELWFRPMIQLASDWDEERSEANIPCGSISGLTAQMQNWIVRKTYVLPRESVKAPDVHTKYYLAWRLGLVRRLGLIISANPSTMVNFARFGDAHRESLIRDVRNGGISADFRVPDDVHRVEQKRLVPNPERAAELERVISETGGLRPKDAWPEFGLLGNWTGGSVGAYMRHYPQFYGEPAVRDIGLIASEGRMTIPLRDHDPGGVLDISSSFFEFVPVDEIDSLQPTVLESHELEEGKDYYILLTTSSGLYRYDIHDVVRCVGWHEQTPLLAFLNKGANFSNLTGEKLSEHQIAGSVERALAELGIDLTSYAVAPCWEDPMPYYGLFVEEQDLAPLPDPNRLAASVERHLMTLNSEYEGKRASHRLAPIRLEVLPTGTWSKWDADRLKRTGGTAEQYKHPVLIPSTDFRDTMPIISPATSAR